MNTVVFHTRFHVWIKGNEEAPEIGCQLSVISC